MSLDSTLPPLSRPLPLDLNTTVNPSLPPSSASAKLNPSNPEDSESVLDVIPSRAGRKLCVRHQQMANQNMNQKLQKVSPKLSLYSFGYRLTR